MGSRPMKRKGKMHRMIMMYRRKVMDKYEGSLIVIFAIFVIFVTFVIFAGSPSLVCLEEVLFLLLSLASFVISLNLFFRYFRFICGAPPRVFLKALILLLVSLASFVIFAIFLEKLLFLLLSSLFLLFICYFRCIRYFCLLLYLWGPLPLYTLRKCYSCCCRLLHLLFSLNLLFSLFSLYLWGSLPLSCLKKCYSCC